MTRGNNKNTIFRFDIDYLQFLSIVEKYKEELPFNLYHYCLMPNHVHLLVQTKKAKDFSLFMKKLNLSYFHYYRKKYRWSGHFWQDRFKSQPIGKDEYFIQCGKYIELNPVRANMVSNPEDYNYSSMQYYVQGKKNKLITDDLKYKELGDTDRIRQEKYRDLVISDIIVNRYKDKVWGSDNQRYNETRKVIRHIQR